MTDRTHIQTLIDSRLRGDDLPSDHRVDLYEDPHAGGYAYRVTYPDGHQESGGLVFLGWSEEEGVAGYILGAYFAGADGEYLGPDCDGICPLMSAE